jgi:TusA-related sulfurtransferase
MNKCEQKRRVIMQTATNVLDLTGLNLSESIFKIAAKTMAMQKGEILEIIARYPNFEQDVRLMCSKFNRRVVVSRKDGGDMRCRIEG